MLDNVDALLFSMLVLKGFVDSSGKMWRCFPQQLYLVEATYRLTKQVHMPACSIYWELFTKENIQNFVNPGTITEVFLLIF